MAIQYTAIDFWNKLYENNFSYTSNYKKKVHESNADVETLQEDITAFKKTVRDLTGYTKSVTSPNRLEKKLKSLIKTYNSMDKNAANVSNKELGEQFEKLEELFSENEKDLKKIGVKRTDKKFEFDSEIFEDADKRIINKLFEGRNCFIKQADKLMRKIEECADNSQYSVGEHTFFKTTKYSDMEMALSYSFAYAKGSIKLLGLYGSLMELGEFSQEYKEDCEEELNYFTDYVYNNATYFEDENYNKMRELCESKEEELAKIGITFETDESGNTTMKYDKTKADLSDPDVQSAYLSLFGEDSEFLKALADYCDKGFHSVIKPDKIGVSIVDEYV